jgi:hypothetical protein
MVRKKTVFIAHPVAGDIAENVRKALQICGQAHKDGYVPVAPYIISVQYLDDAVEEDRRLGMDANIACFERRFIDELWLFGDRISAGMKEEIALALDLNIPIVAKTEATKKELEELLSAQKE